MTDYQDPTFSRRGFAQGARGRVVAGILPESAPVRRSATCRSWTASCRSTLRRARNTRTTTAGSSTSNRSQCCDPDRFATSPAWSRSRAASA